MKVLFLGKQRDDFYCTRAMDFLRQQLPETQFVLAVPGQKFPAENLKDWEGDYIISYLCPWVLPGWLLSKARVAAINFHPAPPQYPGTGCTNFALYNEEAEYGVMCHHMSPNVDSGKVIAVRRFAVFQEDSVYSLTQRCYAYMLTLFFDILSRILLGKPLPESDETWTRKPYRKTDLDALKIISPDMPVDEIRRRVRAVTYPGYAGATMEIDGMRFEYVPPKNGE
jgi:methionyl-tRNA formyltransferase